MPIGLDNTPVLSISQHRTIRSPPQRVWPSSVLLIPPRSYWRRFWGWQMWMGRTVCRGAGGTQRELRRPQPHNSLTVTTAQSPQAPKPHCPEAMTFNACAAVIPCCLVPCSKGLPQAPSQPGAATSPGGLATTQPSSVDSGGSPPITALRFVVSSHVVAPKSKAGRTAHTAGKKHKKKPGRC